MNITALIDRLGVFRSRRRSSEYKEKLLKDCLLMTITRASSSDANVASMEVRTIQGIIFHELGIQLSAAEIRVAAKSRIHDSASFDKCLASARKHLDSEDRRKIVKCLARVLKSDSRVNVLEIDFLNSVVTALDLTPAEMIGLKTGDS